MEALVTGAAGFIGSHLVEEYLKNDVARLIVFDDFSTGTMENLKHVEDNRLRTVKGSVLDRRKLDRTVQEEAIQIIKKTVVI